MGHPSCRHDYYWLGCKYFKSTLHTELWLGELKGDPDEEFLSDGIINGFQPIPADARLVPAEMNNYISSTGSAVRDKVESTLLEEIAIGNYVISEVKPTIVSAVSEDSEEIRLIHDST